MAYLIIDCFLLHLGVLCVLRMCGVYVRHHLPSLHPCPMAVFRCQHLRMGPVRLAHRLVSGFLQIFFFWANSHLHLKKNSNSCQVSQGVLIFNFSSSPTFCRERRLFTNCVPLDSVCVHWGGHTVQRSEELSCRPVSTFCCSLVIIIQGQKQKSQYCWIRICVSTNIQSWFCFPPSIGYPVVTLGFGFKSYVSYKMRLRKQKEVQKENEFYMQLLQQALPPEQQMLQRLEREAEEGETLAHKNNTRHTDRAS